MRVNLNLKDYLYELPDHKIAKYPLENRSDSKLLHFHHGNIDDYIFHQIPELLRAKSLLVFNDTKVIPARLVLHKETGARIEIFLLEPILPSSLHEEVMGAKSTTQWKVMIGNAKKWKEGTELEISIGQLNFKARRNSSDTVTFTWTSDLTFSEVLIKIGEIPLPPYLDREATEEDIPRYQTVYSKHEGAVAAPTAGLHFTDEVIDQISKKGIAKDFLTLHVSAGTFQPIKSDNVKDHPMHQEQIVVKKSNVLNLLNHDTIIPVGTTSMRTLESMYWFGQLLSQDENSSFFITKETAYQFDTPISRKESLENILRYMDANQQEAISGNTEIFIYPGYNIKMCDGLITNFHQPGSTLILLVAALLGEDWKNVYDHALQNDYRFLSYGDSSLLMP